MELREVHRLSSRHTPAFGGGEAGEGYKGTHPMEDEGVEGGKF